MTTSDPNLPGKLVRTPPVSNEALNALFAASWARHTRTDYEALHARALTYVCAFTGDGLVGYVRVAWDGGRHAFVLDPTVHPDYRRRGIGMRLMAEAAAVAREHQVEWLHVDFVPDLRPFYERCGFRPTEAGLLHLAPPHE
jgi:GNAT superfamily N-acetyltransferase